MRALYLSLNKTKCYLIPTTHPLPPGDFTIHTLSGQERQVDEAALAEFAISEDEAKQFIQAQMKEGLEQTKDAIVKALALVVQEVKQKQAERAKQPPSPGVTMLLGFTPDELRQNPDKAIESLGQFFEGLKIVLNGVTSEKPSEQEAAKATLQAFRNKLEESGIPATDALETLPERLHTAAQAENRDQRLNRLAQSLEELGTQLKQTLHQEASQLRMQTESGIKENNDSEGKT